MEHEAQCVIEQIAQQNNVSVDDVMRDMQAAIDDAWGSLDPAVQAQQRKLFPHGQPSFKAFILVMAAQTK